MKLTLDRWDLKEEHFDISCSLTRFEHFKSEVQAVIKCVGRATFREQDRSNYNVIYLPDEPGVVFQKRYPDTPDPFWFEIEGGSVLNNFRIRGEVDPQGLLEKVKAGEVVFSVDAEYRIQPEGGSA